MTRISNIFGTTFSGRIGKKMVAATWKGHEYVRTYVKPPNPNTENQQEARGTFAKAVKTWHQLSDVQQDFYEAIAEKMSGFNLFISRYVTAVQEEEEPETPIEVAYVTSDRKPVQIGKLAVKAGGQEIFNVSLKGSRAVVALTPSDSPYTFILRRGRAEEAVLKVRDLSETGVPKTLESERLGIRLVAEC
jgi:hypothetical protein